MLTFWGDCQKVSRRKAETVGGRPAKMDMFEIAEAGFEDHEHIHFFG